MKQYLGPDGLVHEKFIGTSKWNHTRCGKTLPVDHNCNGEATPWKITDEHANCPFCIFMGQPFNQKDYKEPANA